MFINDIVIFLIYFYILCSIALGIRAIVEKNTDRAIWIAFLSPTIYILMFFVIIASSFKAEDKKIHLIAIIHYILDWRFWLLCIMYSFTKRVDEKIPEKETYIKNYNRERKYKEKTRNFSIVGFIKEIYENYERRNEVSPHPF